MTSLLGTAVLALGIAFIFTLVELVTAKYQELGRGDLHLCWCSLAGARPSFVARTFAVAICCQQQCGLINRSPCSPGRAAVCLTQRLLIVFE